MTTTAASCGQIRPLTLNHHSSQRTPDPDGSVALQESYFGRLSSFLVRRMAPLQAWIVPKLLKLASEAKDPFGAILDRGGDVQILQFITWESPFWAVVGDQEHRIVVRLTDQSLAPLKKLDPSIPSFRYAIISLSRYQPLLVASHEGAPKEIAFKIHALRLKSKTETVPLNERLKDVSAVGGKLVDWVKGLSSSTTNGNIETVPPPSQDPSLEQQQEHLPSSLTSNPFPTPRGRFKTASSSPPMSERLGMEWWEMSPTPEPGERVEGEEGEGREEMMMEGVVNAASPPPRKSPSPAAHLSSSFDELEIRPALTRQTLHLRTTTSTSTSSTSTSHSPRAVTNDAQSSVPPPTSAHSSKPASASTPKSDLSKTDSSQTDSPSQSHSQSHSQNNSQPLPKQATRQKPTNADPSPRSSQTTTTDTYSSPSHFQSQNQQQKKLSDALPSSSPPAIVTGTRRKTTTTTKLGPTPSKVLVENSDSERSFGRFQSQSQSQSQSQPHCQSDPRPSRASPPSRQLPSTFASASAHPSPPSASTSSNKSVYIASSGLYVPSTILPHSTSSPPAGQKRLQNGVVITSSSTNPRGVGSESMRDSPGRLTGSGSREGEGMTTMDEAEMTRGDMSEVRPSHGTLVEAEERNGQGEDEEGRVKERKITREENGKGRAKPTSTSTTSFDTAWASPSFLSSPPSNSTPSVPLPQSKNLKRKASHSPPAIPSTVAPLGSWDPSSRPCSTQHAPRIQHQPKTVPAPASKRSALPTDDTPSIKKKQRPNKPSHPLPRFRPLSSSTTRLPTHIIVKLRGVKTAEGMEELRRAEKNRLEGDLKEVRALMAVALEEKKGS